MCGVVGFLGQSSPALPAQDLLRRMIADIRHRGPDEEGYFLDGLAGLGHARLSIVDLAHGQQPMANEDQSVVLSFNGEIFNHVELREDLKARGHRFRTRSDTEVILRLYEEKGADCVDDLNGDFAFAIWDGRLRRMMLARDRMGVRPLYYATIGNALYFASEIKALANVPEFDPSLDPFALDQIFTFWFPLPPRTPFRSVSELPPAHVLLATEDNVTVRPYWNLDFSQADDRIEIDRKTEDRIAEELRALLMGSVSLRMRADVPVGAYLSGGLDSSVITAAANRQSPQNLRSFSVAFETAEFDESAYQQRMVEALGARHSDILCRHSDIGRLFPDVIAAAERPLVRTAPAPLLALSGLVRGNGFKVVLTGEGADELFAGYDIFKEAKLRRFCAAQPGSKSRPLLYKRLYEYMPGLQSQSQRYLEAFFGADNGRVDDPLFSHLPRFASTMGAKIFFSEQIKEDLKGYDALDDLRAALPAEINRWHPMSRAQYLETAFLLPGYILSSQGDRVSMANSVEGRFPFLDHRLVEFAARLAPKLKMRGLREKHILRKAMSDLLPADICARPKQPYRAPASPSFVGPAAPGYVDDLLSDAAIGDSGYFNPGAVRKLHNKCRKRNTGGFRDNTALTGIISTQLWHRQFVLKQPVEKNAP